MRILRGEDDREVVAQHGKHALEHAVAGAVGVAEVVLHGGEDRSRVRLHAVMRTDVEAELQLRVEQVAPVAETVERAVLEQLGVLRPASPERIPGCVVVVGVGAVLVAGKVVGAEARVGLDPAGRAVLVEVDGDVAHRAARLLPAAVCRAELVRALELEGDVLGQFRLEEDSEGGELLVAHVAAVEGLVVLVVLVDHVELVWEALVEQGVVPDESAAPLVHLRRVGGMDGVHWPAAGVARAVAVHVAAVVVEGEGVELRRVGRVEGHLEHVGVRGAGADVGRAVEERAVESEDGVSALEEVLAADAEVEEAVEQLAALEVEAVERDLVGEVVRAVLAAHAVLDDVLAELVDEAAVEREVLVVEAAPDARAEADVVDVLLVRAWHHGAGVARIADNVVHDLLADAEVRACVGLKARRFGRRHFWDGVGLRAGCQSGGKSAKG